MQVEALAGLIHTALQPGDLRTVCKRKPFKRFPATLTKEHRAEARCE